jgi:hypothetical protein
MPRNGPPVLKAENAVLPGITAATDAIAYGMTVDPSCTGLLAEMPAYAWKPERGTGEMTDARQDPRRLLRRPPLRGHGVRAELQPLGASCPAREASHDPGHVDGAGGRHDETVLANRVEIEVRP